MRWQRDDTGFDEIFERQGNARPHYEEIVSVLGEMSDRELRRRERLQKVSLLNQGITFAVYGDKEGVERVFPFDFVPRVVQPGSDQQQQQQQQQAARENTRRRR